MTGDTYQAAGVDTGFLEDLKEQIKGFSALTHGPEVLDSGGSFAGLYRLSGYRQPVLVASTDGVGTKVKIAAQMGHYESVGQDVVSLNVNDIITKGAMAFGGSPLMAPWPMLSADEVANVIAYVRSLKQ